MPLVNRTQLENASVDCDTIETAVNGSATLNGNGSFYSRLGTQLRTFASIVGRFGTEFEDARDDAYNQIVTGSAALKTAENVALLPALSGLVDAQTVILKGYYTALDGGDQQLVYRSTGRTGITVDNGFFFNAGGADDYFESINKNVIDLVKFGCKGDGLTDDSLRIVAAFDAVTSDKIIYIPAGHYIYNSDNTTSTDLEIQSNVSIIGDGDNCSVIEVTGTTNVALIYALNKKNIAIKGIRFIGNNIANNFSKLGTAIWLDHSDAAGTTDDGNITVDDCSFHNFSGAYWVSIQNDRTSATNTVSNVTFRGLKFTGGNDYNPSNLGVAARQVGVHCTGTGGLVTKVSFTDCICDAYSVKVGIGLQGGGGSTITRVSISDCEIYRAGNEDALASTGRYGILSYTGVDDITINGCVLEDCFDCGVYLLDADRAVVSNNRFIGNPGITESSLLKGGLVCAAASAVITGNLFEDNVYHLSISASTSQIKLIVSGNSFKNGLIRILAPNVIGGVDNYGTSITANEFENSGIAFRSGVGVSAFWRNFVISGNNFFANAALDYFISGDSYKGFPNMQIVNNTFDKLASAVMGHAVKGDTGPNFADGLIVKGNTFRGTYTSYVLSCNGTKDFTFFDNLIEDSSPAGVQTMLYFPNVQGVANHIRFRNCDMTKIVKSTGGIDFMNQTPTHTGQAGDHIQGADTNQNVYWDWNQGTVSWDATP